jgi:hypothetical protein
VPYEGTAVEQLVAHRTRAPRNPAARYGDIPADLGEIVMCCMAKQPQHRWGRAEEVVQALRHVLAAVWS